MKLDTQERIILSQLLPKEGTVITLKLVRELRESLSFSDEEQGRLGFAWSDDGKTLNWNLAKDEAKDFDFSKTAVRLIEDTLTALDKSGKLTMKQLSLYERFCEQQD